MTTFLKICVLWVLVALAIAAFGVSPLLVSDTVQQSIVAPPPQGGSVRLSWTPPTNTAGITGYRIKWSLNTNTWPNSMSVGLLTNATINGLPERVTNWFLVVSVNTQNVESVHSAVTNRFIYPRLAFEPYVFAASLAVAANTTNVWQTSTNATTWSNVRTQIVSIASTITLLVTNDAPQRFVRLR